MAYCQFQCMVLSLYFIGFVVSIVHLLCERLSIRVSGMAPFCWFLAYLSSHLFCSIVALLESRHPFKCAGCSSTQSPAHPSYILSSVIIATVVLASFAVSSLMCLQAREFSQGCRHRRNSPPNLAHCIFLSTSHVSSPNEMQLYFPINVFLSLCHYVSLYNYHLSSLKTTC